MTSIATPSHAKYSTKAASSHVSAYGCILTVSFRPLHPFHAVTSADFTHSLQR